MLTMLAVRIIQRFGTRCSERATVDVAINDLLSVDNTYVSIGPFFYALRSLRKKVKICAEKDTAVKLITLRQHLVLRSSWAVTLSQSPFANETQFNSQKK